MFDFAQWCQDKGYAEIKNDGTVAWTEASGCCHTDPVKGGKPISHKEKMSGKVRATTSDLSNDYKGHYSHMGTVWPFKVVAKGSGKAVASVAK